MMPFKSLQASACHSQMCTLVWEWGWGANHDIDKKKAADLCVKKRLLSLDPAQGRKPRCSKDGKQEVKLS